MEKTEEKQTDVQPTEPQKPVVDVFGEQRNADGSIATPELPKQEENKEKEPKTTEVPVTDLDNHPTVIALRKEKSDLEERTTKLENDRKSMGESIVNMRQKADEVKKRMKEAESEVPHKNIQRTKDLKKEELEAMTETEKRLMDTVADMQEATNKQFLTNRQKEIEAEIRAAETTDKDDATTKFNDTVQKEAMKLAGDDKSMANQIIENFNLFKDNDKLSGKALAERLAKAAAMTDGYKPPKEQKSQKGSPVAPAGAGDDPFGVGQIIDDVKKQNKGSYTL